MTYFVYNNENSSEYGVFISGEATFATPKRKTSKVTVAGRNGDLIMEDDEFENISIKYPAFIRENLGEKLDNFASMLASVSGYVRLEDTYHPEYYRMAHYEEGFNPKTTPYNRGGKFDIYFDCMPQKFLKEGEKKITLESNGILKNPTRFKSKPLLRIYGTGTLIIQGQRIVINSADGYTDIDCEIMEAYKGNTNCNAKVSLPDNIYLFADNNQITLSGVTRVEVTPKWWTI